MAKNIMAKQIDIATATATTLLYPLSPLNNIHYERCRLNDDNAEK